MTNKIINTAVLALLLTLAQTTYAMSKPLEGRPEMMRPEEAKSRQDRMEPYTNKMMPSPGRMGSTTDTMRDREDVRMASSTEIRGDAIKKIRGEHINKVGIRIEATIERIQAIINRLISRIEKIKNAGGKTNESEKYISEAQKHLDEAKSMLTGLGGEMNRDMMATSTRKMTMDPAKKMTLDIQKHLVEAQKSLIKAVKALEPLKDPKTATTTEDHTNNQ